MSPPVFAEKDPQIILADALAAYKAASVTATNPSGTTLAAGDPRRLLMQSLLLLVSQLRPLINAAALANLPSYTTADYIGGLMALWGMTPLGATPSKTTLRWTASAPGVLTVPAGKRATDGNGNLWAVDADTSAGTLISPAGYVDCPATCTLAGTQSNGVAIDQIDTIVDPVPGFVSVSNTTSTDDSPGRGAETLPEEQARMLVEPERIAVAGPRGAYEALARAASASVEDCVVIGPNDAGMYGGAAPAGHVNVLIQEVGQDAPTGGLLAVVAAALNDEKVRPLGDYVQVMAPTYVDYDAIVDYWIAASDSGSVVAIRAAVEAAFDAYILWQRKIGRDINPSRLTKMLMDAGACRVEIDSPVAAPVFRLEYAWKAILGSPTGDLGTISSDNLPNVNHLYVTRHDRSAVDQTPALSRIAVGDFLEMPNETAGGTSTFYVMAITPQANYYDFTVSPGNVGLLSDADHVGLLVEDTFDMAPDEAARIGYQSLTYGGLDDTQ